MNAAALATFQRAGTPRQFVYAYLKTGFMPTTQEGRANRTEEQNAEYDAALDEYFDMLDPPLAERSEFSYGDMFDNCLIEKKAGEADRRSRYSRRNLNQRSRWQEVAR